MHSIQLDKQPTSYIPGDEVTGVVQLAEHEKLPDTLDVRLQWTTRGKGDKDTGVVDNQQFLTGATGDGGRFRFKLRIPEDGPYSFSGKYLSVTWAVELHEPPSGLFRQETAALATASLVVSPTGKEIILPNLDPPNPFENRLR